MLAKRFLITVWLCLLAAVALPAQVHEAAPGGEAEAAQHAAQEPAGNGHSAQEIEHAVKGTLEMATSDFFKHLFGHSVPYPIAFTDEHGHAGPFTVYNVQPWQWVCLGLMLIFFLPVVSSFKKGQVGWLTRVLRGFCLWVRDEMVYSVMGKEEGRKFAPLFLFMFFFIVFQNVIGMIPSVGHSFPLAIYTPTGTPYVTGAMALIVLALMVGLGIKHNGAFGFFKGLVPHGLPVALVPIMFLIELVSLFVKPFALTIRLFANMLAGHLVIASAIGLVFLFTKMLDGAATSYLTAVPCVGMAIFIYTIEAFVTLLQAYIFTFLAVNFIHQSMHQHH